MHITGFLLLNAQKILSLTHHDVMIMLENIIDQLICNQCYTKCYIRYGKIIMQKNKINTGF